MNNYINNQDLLYDLHNYGTSLKFREIFLHNHYSDDGNPGVEYQMSNTFIKNLRCLELKSSDPITIHMHSIGGSWPDGMVIYDAIKMSKCYITIIVYGQAESMSSVVLQAADTRYITANSYFMCHFGNSDISGNYLDVQNWIRYEKNICENMIDIYAQSCVGGKYFRDKYGNKPNIDKIKTYLYRKLKSGDWYMSAEDSVKYGFIDKVIHNWESE